MTSTQIKAEQVLVAASVNLIMMTVRDERFPMWVSVLEEILPDTMRCAEPLVPLRAAAQELVRAPVGRSRDGALARVCFEVKTYYALVAARRYESWREANGESVVEA